MPRTRNQEAEGDGEDPSVTMSQGQFTTLLESLQRSQLEMFTRLINERDVRTSTPAPTDTSTLTTPTANFAKCTARFNGSQTDIDGFIDAIEVYKNCLQISDENAIKGLSMLLTDSAAVFWQGVKGSTSTWQDAIEKLTSAFGDLRAPFRIYLELYSMTQGTDTTDLFVAKARALLSRLPKEDLTEKVQLDMIYGLLDRRIRKRLDRNSVTTFDQLLLRARAIEQSLRDGTGDKTPTTPARVQPPGVQRVGELIANSATSSSSAVQGVKKLSCNYCKKWGHEKSQCKKLLLQNDNKSVNSAIKNKQIQCYGCGTPNVIKSNCPKCSTSEKNQGHSAFYSLADSDSRSVPTVRNNTSRSARRRPAQSDTLSAINAPLPTLPPPRGSGMVTGTAGATATSSSAQCMSPSSHYVQGNPAHVAGDSLNKHYGSVFKPCGSVPSVPFCNCLQYTDKVKNDHLSSQKMCCVDNNVNVISMTSNDNVDNRICSDNKINFIHDFCNNNLDNRFCVKNCYCCVNRNSVCVCMKTKMCVCTTCVQGERASTSQVSDSTLRSVMFNGCQSGNSDGLKSCARDFMPITDDNKPFDNNTSDSQHFFGKVMDAQHFFENNRGSQQFSKNTCDVKFLPVNSNDSQQLCGITSGSQPFFGNRTNVRSFCRPVLKISILGENGTAMVDSAAKSCVAGHTLYALLKAKGHPMSSCMENVKLADGVSRLMKVLTTEVNVTLEGRTRLVRFLIFPDADSNESLLGIDFLVKFNVSMDFSNAIWHFADSLKYFDLLFEIPACHVESVPISRFHASQLTPFVNRDDTPPLPIIPKRNRGRPRHIQPVSDVHERVHDRGRFHEPEGECIAEVSERRLPGRYNRGRMPKRYSPTP